jgi:hypothetical protein
VPHRSSARQRALLALAGTGILAGCVLTSGAAVPLMTDLVAMAASGSADTGAPDPSSRSAAGAAGAAEVAVGRTVNGNRVALSKAATGWMEGDQRPEWGRDRLVPQGPTGSDAPQEPQDPGVPQIQVPENPKGRVLFNPGQAMPRYELKPRPDCPQQYGMDVMVKHLTAVSTVAGTANLTWWDPNDPNNTGYEIDAILVATGQVTTTLVKPPQACTDVSVDIPGLTSGAKYKFIVSELAVSEVQSKRVYRIGRGQTPEIVIA